MRKIIWIVSVLTIILGGIYFCNYVTLTKPVMEIIDSDNRNKGIEIDLHYKNYILPNILIFNLKNVADDKAIADVFRVFLQTTSGLKEREFENIELAFKGKSKFKIGGKYFRQLGEEYENQNPVYTMRTFPEHILNIQGQSIYSEWTGGLLGVLNKQMEDFNDFHKKWYLDDLSNSNY